MQSLEVSGAVRPIYGSLGVKRLIRKGLFATFRSTDLRNGPLQDKHFHEVRDSELRAVSFVFIEVF